MLNNQGADAGVREREPSQVSVLDVLILIGMKKWIFIWISCLGTAGFLVLALLVPRQYSATTLMLIPQQQQQGGAAMLLAQLGSLAGMSGGGAVRASDDLFVSLLKSRRIKGAIVQQFGLIGRYQAGSPLGAEEMLSSFTTVSLDKKTGLLSISVDDKEAKFSADLANAYVKELQKLLSELTITEAQQRQAFLDKQVAAQRQMLDAAEKKFRSDLVANGMSLADVAANSVIKAGIDLRAQIAAAEVRLGTLRQFSTDENVDVQRARGEVTILRRQLEKMEGGKGMDEISSSTKNPAEASYRDYKVRQATLDVLVQQQELARIDVAKDGPLLQQVDMASVPERPTKPSRALIVIMGGLSSIVVAALLALASAGLQSADGEFRGKLARLKGLWF